MYLIGECAVFDMGCKICQKNPRKQLLKYFIYRVVRKFELATQ